MLRATFRSLLSRKRRLVLSVLAIVLGVLFMTGAFVFTETVEASSAARYARMFRDVDVVVAASAVPAGPDDTQPVTTVPASLLRQVARQPGVHTVTGVVDAPGVRLLDRHGKVLDAGASVTSGTNWRDDAAFGSYVRLRAGRAPASDDEIAVNAKLAEAADLAPGRTATMLTADLTRQTFTVVGVYGYAGGRDSAGGACEVALRTPAAQRLVLTGADQYTALHVTAEPGLSAGRLRDGIARAVGGAYQVRTGRAYAAGLIDRDNARGRDVFRRILLGFAGISVGVGVLLIANTFLILVAQRTRELALLRALGASRRQLVGSVLTEAATVGIVGSLLGVALGVGLGALLVLVVGHGIGLDLGSPRVPPIALVIGFVIGVPVTVLASLPPVVRASRIPPVAAMREAPAAGAAARPRLIRALGTAAHRVGSLPRRAVTGQAAPGRLLRRAVTGQAAPGRLLRRAVAGRAVAGRLSSWSVAGRLGWRNALRSPRRTLLTAAAIMIGTTVTVGASVVVASANASLREQVSRELDIALMVQASGDGGGITPAALERIAALDGVDAVTGSRFETVRIAVPGRAAPVEREVDSVTDLPAAVRMFSLAARSGRLATTAPDSVLVDAATAAEFHLTAGSTVTMTFSRDQSRTVTVSGVYADSSFLPGWVAGADLARSFTSQRASQVAVAVASRPATRPVRASIEAMFASDPMITVSSPDEVLDAAGAKYDQVLLAVQGLLAITVVIAVLGVVNTLTLSVLERIRELGTLRAIGLRRGQTVRMIATESVVISVLGGTCGLVLGLVLGWAGVHALADQGVTRTAMPWFDLGCYLVLSVVIGVVAALPPARRAARTNVLAAIASPG